jgi:AcrR family transcriptional regulator
LQKQAPAAHVETASISLPAKSRSERRREDTRRRLIKATYEIIARRGFEGLVIQDITAAADVGYGSFYNHFLSKDAIVSAAIDAAREHLKQMYERLDGLTADRAEAFAMDLRLWLHQSKTDNIWGWFMIRTILSGEELRSGVGGVLKRALDAGVRDGVFRPEDIDMAHEMIGGVLLLATLKLVSSDVPDDYPDKIVAAALKTLALPIPKIAEVMSKPLPNVELSPFLEALS